MADLAVYSLSEAARILKLSNTQVRRLADEGRIEKLDSPYGRLLDKASVDAEAERRSKKKGRR